MAQLPDEQSHPAYWFPAKRYGWGWGLPRTWQGWLVVVGFFAAVALAMAFAGDAAPFVVVALGVVLLIVCMAKGEPPRWRWGRWGGKD